MLECETCPHVPPLIFYVKDSGASQQLMHLYAFSAARKSYAIDLTVFLEAIACI